MSTFRKAVVAITALAASFATMSSASAVPTYPDATDVQITLDVASCQIGGTFLEIHAKAMSGADSPAGTTTITAVGKTFTENDNDLRVKVKTPIVTQSTKFKVTAKFVPTDHADAAASPQSTTQVIPAFYSTGTSKVLPTSFRTATASETVTLVPRSVGCSAGEEASTGILPDTGGTNLWYLIVGALLLAAGAVLLTAARRRSKNSV